MPNSIGELKEKGNTRKNYFKTFWTLTRSWHLIWNSRQLWLFFTFVIFHQATEDQWDKNTNVKSWAHWDNSVHVKILWKKDSESYNYCSINIGTKLNLYISVDHSVMLPQIVLEEKNKYILVFHTMCVVPKRMTVLVHQWIHYPRETVVYFKPVGPMRKEPRWRPWWTCGWTSSLRLQLQECVFMPGLHPSINVSFSFKQIFIVCAS